MSGNPEFDAAYLKTQEFADLLGKGKSGDLDWQDQLDASFINGLFDHDYEQPYMIGPDGKRYFAFKLPQTQKILPIIPSQPLDDMVEWGAGAAILNQRGEAVYVYSPGDVVSFKLFGQTVKRWQGGWAELPDAEAYFQGGEMEVGMPNEHMMPPLAARCADFYLRHWMKSFPYYAGREPGVCLIRMKTHNRPEDASDLIFNIFSDDEPVASAGEGMATYIGSLLPRHLANRVITGNREPFGNFTYTPLREYFEKAGLSPISE